MCKDINYEGKLIFVGLHPIVLLSQCTSKSCALYLNRTTGCFSVQIRLAYAGFLPLIKDNTTVRAATEVGLLNIPNLESNESLRWLTM